MYYLILVFGPMLEAIVIAFIAKANKLLMTLNFIRYAN